MEMLKFDRTGALAAWLGATMVAITAMLAGPAVGATSSATCNSADIVDHALSAVVNIAAIRVLPSDNDTAADQTKKHFELFAGSGSIIDPSGVIVTNKHVIQDAAVILVTLQDKTQMPAHLIAAAGRVDLAVIKVDAPNPLPALSFGNSDVLRIGQPVIAVGNPLGIGTSVNTGVISAVNRNLMRTPFDDFIQTDASINPGNSGGPLLDCTGNIIGVNTALLSNNSLLGSIGLGFSLPANDANFVSGMLREPHPLPPNWVGLRLQDVSGQLAMVFNLPNTDGAVVAAVDPDSPAARASLAPGDVITAVDGHPMSDSRAILRAIVLAPRDSSLSFSVRHEDQVQDVTMRTEPWPHMMALRGEVLPSAASIARAEAGPIGLHLAIIADADRQRYGLGHISGVLIDRVTPGSQAANMDLHAGDVIRQVGRRPASTPEGVMAQLTPKATAPGNFVALLVRRKADTKWSTLWIGRINPEDLATGPVMSAASGQSRDAAAKVRSPGH